MAFDLDIIPGSPQSLRWGQLRDIFLGVVSCEDEQIPSDISLFRSSSKKEVQEDEELGCPGYYYFDVATYTTMSLIVEPKPGGQEDVDYIDDFGRNATPEFKGAVLRVWEAAGFLVTLTSRGGRPKGELQRMAHMARCIAILTEGYVIVMDDGVFWQTLGIYAPDDFASHEG